MNGREMYEKWQQFMSEEGCGTDDWEDLDEIDQAAWEKLAVYVST